MLDSGAEAVCASTGVFAHPHAQSLGQLAARGLALAVSDARERQICERRAHVKCGSQREGAFVMERLCGLRAAAAKLQSCTKSP